MTAGRPVSVGPATTLRQAANLMRGHTIGCLLVVEKGKLVGLVTTTDLLDQLGRGATRPTVLDRASTCETGARSRSRTWKKGHTPCHRTETRPSASAPRSTAALCASRIAPTTGQGHPRPNVRHIPACAYSCHRNDTRSGAQGRGRSKLGVKLGKFASSIERVSVHLSTRTALKGGRSGMPHQGCAQRLAERAPRAPQLHYRAPSMPPFTRRRAGSPRRTTLIRHT